MKKNQPYTIFKFNSSRLHESNYNISLTLSQSRKNGELIALGDSQMLRCIRKLCGREDTEEQLQTLFSEKKRIKKEYSIEKASLLLDVERKIDTLLFCGEIVSVVIEDARHYEHIIQNKFFVNNHPYVRLLAGAGNLRRSTVIFVREDIEQPLKKLLNNERGDIQLSPAKFNAYFSLTSSASVPVSEPYFCVIPDCTTRRTEKVDYITEGTPDDHVEAKEQEVEFNLFDGMGVISPRQAQVWAGDLELDYIPSAFIVRNAFMKGMLAVVDFHAFSEQLGRHQITDVWGNKVNLRDIDVVLTESQLKLWKAYLSCSHYQKACRANGMLWGVSRVTPKEDKRYVFSNYQFLQVLDLNDSQIEKLCAKTLDFLSFSIKDDPVYALLYLLGKKASQPFNPDILDSLHDTVTRALILNPNLLQDPYVQNYLVRSLNKKIRESYMGNLLLDGNYQIMISDPYAFMEHLFGLPVKGLLQRGEHYSAYWNSKQVKTVAACRAPLTWQSEVNILHFQQNEELDYWYQHLGSGIIYNVHGNDCMRHADSDWDGDLVMTTDQEEFICGAQGGLPVTYTKNVVGKGAIVEKELYKTDILSFDSKIGYITNCSTTMYAMLPLFPTYSPEHAELTRRLKICRKEQGNEIDKTKGLTVKPFPRHWTQWNKPTGQAGFDQNIEFYNRILVDKRPYFMRWLYSAYNKKYRQHLDGYNNLCIFQFGMGLKEVMALETKTPAMTDILEKYQRFAPLLETPCLMNRICFYMESHVQEMKEKLDILPIQKNMDFLKDPSIRTDPEKLKKLHKIYVKYKSGKRNFATLLDEQGVQKYRTLEQYHKAIRMEAMALVSPNLSELANHAVDICYEIEKKDNKSFLWQVFGEGLVDNIRKNRVEPVKVPFLNGHGTIPYLDRMYNLFEIDMGEEEFDVNDYL